MGQSEIHFVFEWVRKSDQKVYTIEYMHKIDWKTNKFTDVMKKLTQI